MNALACLCNACEAVKLVNLKKLIVVRTNYKVIKTLVAIQKL